MMLVYITSHFFLLRHRNAR